MVANQLQLNYGPFHSRTDENAKLKKKNPDLVRHAVGTIPTSGSPERGSLAGSVLGPSDVFQTQGALTAQGYIPYGEDGRKEKLWGTAQSDQVDTSTNSPSAISGQSSIDNDNSGPLERQETVENEDTDSTISRFQRKTVDAGGVRPTVEAIEALVKEFRGNFPRAAFDINIVSTESDLPAHVLAAAREQGADGQLYAVHDAGAVHIVADKMQSENRSKSKVANTWLSTGYKDKSGEAKEGYDNLNPTHDKPTLSRQAVGADNANTSKIIRVRNKPCENGPLRTLIKIERLIRPKRQRAGFHKAREF